MDEFPTVAERTTVPIDRMISLAVLFGVGVQGMAILGLVLNGGVREAIPSALAAGFPLWQASRRLRRPPFLQGDLAQEIDCTKHYQKRFAVLSLIIIAIMTGIGISNFHPSSVNQVLEVVLITYSLFLINVSLGHESAINRRAGFAGP
ncbi:hypothetical protein [Luteococcus sp. OSA5]|uniref:hypothetical protein n=1 Tax=Luteococcus sp. OSA5 TaxID=3401630 RepID=UPI003B4348CA